MKRAVLVTFATVVVLVGLIGLAHTAAARPVLLWVGAVAGCPVTSGTMDRTLVEATRIRSLDGRMGTIAARSRSFFTTELGRTTRRQLEKWSALRQAGCEEERGGAAIRCPAASVDQRACRDVDADVLFVFDDHDLLVALDATYRLDHAEEALGCYTVLQDRLTANLGEASSTRGAADPDWLAQPLRRLTSEHRTVDTTATVTAINLGRRGIRVRTQIQWRPTAPAAPLS